MTEDVSDLYVQEAQFYVFYRWDCPYCGNVNDEEMDAADDYTCGGCAEKVHVIDE